MINTPDTPAADQTPPLRVQPDAPRPAQTTPASTATTPPASGWIRRRTTWDQAVLLGGLGAAALAAVPSALLLLDTESDPRNTATLTDHTGDVESVAFSPDRTTLATGSSDKTARLWKVG